MLYREYVSAAATVAEAVAKAEGKAERRYQQQHQRITSQHQEQLQRLEARWCDV